MKVKPRDVIRIVMITLFAAAIVQEMKKPPEQRTWHGRVLGLVPYDFRFPTIDRLKEAYWDPENPRILTDRVLGVGWGVNFGRLLKLARECCREQSGQTSYGESN